MDSQPSPSPRSAQSSGTTAAAGCLKSTHETETGTVEGLLFPPPEDDGLIRSVLDLTRKLAKLGIIEVVPQPGGGDAYRILPKPRKRIFTRNELAQRVGTIFGRRPTTPWAKDEIEAFKVIESEIDTAELELVEAYYKSEARKPEAYCRTRLLTFLRHYPGEVDRARRWQDNSSRRHCY